MVLQDLVLSAGAFVLLLALVPSLISNDKPALATSILTGSVLAVFAAVYFSLGLWLATLVTFLTACLWLALAFQKYTHKQ